MNLFKEFQEYVQKEFLFEPNDKLLLAVSGGVDSMVLLFLLKHFNYNFEVAHVNFQLRAEESDGDELFVKEYCQSHHIPFHVQHFQTDIYAKAAGIGIQEAARNLRYTWFKTLKENLNFNYVLTAHHANDQSETILFHLIRGAGVKGLRGILPKADYLRRPLLFALKANLSLFAKENAIPFRVDSSNLKDTYSRNYLRKQVIPKIIQMQPAFIETTSHTGKLMEATWHFYQEQIKLLRSEILVQTETTLTINLELLTGKEFAPFLLFEFINNLGFNFEQCNLIIDSFTDKNTGAWYYSDTHAALVNRGQLLIQEIDHFTFEPIIISSFPFQLNSSYGTYDFEECAFTGFQPNKLWLDLDKIKFPIQIRSIEIGDRFKPLGLERHQKISDYFINKKINLIQKKSSLVIEFEKQILALLPWQISNDYKVDSSTKKFLCIDIKKKTDQ
ncbi:MAG: tRNA lysidine(34) synthetase TilS [Bacteroidia bacterium]|nr:tRNA lysidine(34) synthetase TilS [Bacteroidia bacterium]MCF8447469.1 tRNA lysidine(34) synthetase TilS [Bacteroidia bacterium]